MFFAKACVIIFALLVNAVCCKTGNGGLNATQQIRYFGYPLEIYEVVTNDGYILELHRIPHGLKEAKKSKGKPVVFIMHGIYCTSGVFTINHRDKSLPYILADKGYDVWLGNQRGTPFSMRHIYLDANRDKKKYWNFTITDLAVSDLSTSIDYVLNKTEKTELHYVGHSQGNLVIYILLAERPEFNSKVRVISLAAISYMTHFPTLFGRALIKFCDAFQSLLRSLEIYKLGISLRVATNFEQIFPLLYEGIYFVQFGGVRSKIFDRKLFPAIAAVLGGDVALNVLVHYNQLRKSGRFCHFNYGKSTNLAVYGQELPPDYNIQNIKAPIAIFYAAKDYLAAKEDQLHFVNQLPNLIFLKEMPYKYYSHFDFLWSKTVREDVYDKVLELIEQTQ